MILLCWASTFGSRMRSTVDSTGSVAEQRGLADAATLGSWVPHDRATLGVLFYRGLELAAVGKTIATRGRRAKTLLRIASQGYRATKMLDLVPVALGLWAEAERRCGNAAQAQELAREASGLLRRGLTEPPQRGAGVPGAPRRVGRPRRAGARAQRDRLLHPAAQTRLKGPPPGRPEGVAFVTQLASERGLLAAAEGYDLGAAEDVTEVLGGDGDEAGAA